MAAAIGRPAIAQPTNATAAVVSTTATSTSDASGMRIALQVARRGVECRIEQHRRDEQRQSELRFDLDRPAQTAGRQARRRRAQGARVGHLEPPREAGKRAPRRAGARASIRTGPCLMLASGPGRLSEFLPNGHPPSGQAGKLLVCTPGRGPLGNPARNVGKRDDNAIVCVQGGQHHATRIDTRIRPRHGAHRRSFRRHSRRPSGLRPERRRLGHAARRQ